MELEEVIRKRIRDDGPLPFASYVEFALYHPTLGYYSRAGQRSGRAGDFFTSVDLGPSFGEMLAVQFNEMWTELGTERFDLVEAGAGNGRLTRDILSAASRKSPSFYSAIDVHLVERSSAARDLQLITLGNHTEKLASSGETIPPDIDGVIFANELLDAFPPHVLVMTDNGLREVYVDNESDGTFIERLGPVSGHRVQKHIDTYGIVLQPGWRVEVTPDTVDWVREATNSLNRGFLLLVDYGHEAHELYSAAHARGTLTTYSRHHIETVDASKKSWLVDPGSKDITSHVDITCVRKTAESNGANTLGILDQTYFLIGLGIGTATNRDTNALSEIKKRLAVKSLILPGGLGSTQKVMVFGKNVGQPQLTGLSYQMRIT